MTDSETLLAVLVVGQGIAISWQWNRLCLYRNSLALATMALDSAYDYITGEERKDDKAD